MAKEVPQFVRSSLRSVLLSQKGIKQTSVEQDYDKLTHTKLDFQKYGYQDLFEFLLAIPDVARLEYSPKDGENKVFGVSEKGVYMSVHAKKAEGIPNGLKPLHPSEWPRNKASKERTVVENKSSSKVTVQSDSKKKISPNARGLYALHVKNLPPDCQQSDINRIFKKFSSLAEVKLESSQSNRAAFVRFSSHADAAKALSEMDGYSLRGFSLIINSVTERLSKVSKDDTELAKKKVKAADSRSTLENKELTPVNSIKSTSPQTKCHSSTVVPADNWHSDTGVRTPKAQADGDTFFNQEELAGRVFKMNRGYPIHVSNFPAGTNQKMLKQLFSGCGEIVHIQVQEKFAFIYFSKKEAAITALMTMQNKVKFGDHYLTITPRTPKGQAEQQINVPVASSAVSHCSSQSSLSSISSSMPQSPVNCGISHSAGFGDPTDLGGCVTNVDICDATYSSGDLEKKSYCVGMSEAPVAEERKLDGQTLKPCYSTRSLLSNDGHRPPTELSSSVNLKERFPLHLILTHQEMQILATKCNKPLRTTNNFGFEEFDILVTDVVDSCHFWANVDDKSGSYKRLQKIEEDLKTVEHFKRCMPGKYQLGAALYSEDDKWYRCWCLEVTSISKKEAKVFFVDYGNCEWISWDQFTDIDNKFWDLAPQAVPFKLAGLEHASNLVPGTLNEGSKYLSALICNEVCRARKTNLQDSREPHIIEVELIRRDGTNVNEQMTATRYVHKTGTPTQTAVQNPYDHQSSPFLSLLQLSSQPEKHIPPHPLMKTQTAQPTQSVSQPVQAAQSVSQPVERSTSQDYLQDNKCTEFSQKVFESTKPQSAQGLFQSSRPGGQAKAAQQTVQNAKEDPVAKSPWGLLQHQPPLPNQLFEKQEVIEVFLSSVGSPDALGFFLADQKTKNTLLEIHDHLRNVADPKAAGCKIYPRIGDVVMKVHENRRFRVKIISIPANAGNGIDKVRIKDIDHGKVETISLGCLCKLPASARDIPPQVIQARLAGIRKKQGMLDYPNAAVNCLVAIKRQRQVLQASIIKREPNGLLHVELFEPSSSRPSLNVQLVKMAYAEIDPSQCFLVKSEVALPGSSVSKSLETQRFGNHAPSDGQTPGWQKPGPVERKPDVHQWDTHSVHSDWEDNLIEVQEDWDYAAPSGSHVAAAVHVSKEELYVPPPPDINDVASSLVESARSAKSCAPSATDLTNSIPSSSTERLTNRFQRDTGPSYSSDTPNSELCNIRLPDPVGLVGSTSLDLPLVSIADPGCYVSMDERPPSPTTGSDSSGVYSEGSLNGLSTTESSVNIEDMSLLDRTVSHQYVETNLTKKDWRQEREELVQRDEELKRLLEMPRQDMKKMISLRQEKEKLERKIRIKGLENQILKLQKELKNLEMDKAELESEVNQ